MLSTQLEGLHKKKDFIEVTGGRVLSGNVAPDGAKNSALIQLAATAIIEDGFVTLENLPSISDVYDEIKMLEEVGFIVKQSGDQATIAGGLKGHEFSKEYGSRIRASLAFLGSVLPRTGEIILPMPGGDKIGDRPIDIHRHIMKDFGIESEIINGFIHAKAKSLPLKACHTRLRYPSVLATINGILLAVLAEGTTIIENAAKEPEIVDCTNLLLKMGADIHGVGTNRILVHGVKSLRSASHEVMPDRLEAGALLMSIAMTGGTGRVERLIPEHNKPLLSIFNDLGIKYYEGPDYIEILESDINNGFEVETNPFPGLATDLQPILTALALKGKKKSIITDTVFKERFAHVGELRKLGADIKKFENTIHINPVEQLSSAEVTGGDIRAVVSLINASLITNGTTKVYGIDHLDRGHANFVEKLKSLNADIAYK
jgi:UDP-N-acetylglucosamine 1-carboxyvinyltransferase